MSGFSRGDSQLEPNRMRQKAWWFAFLFWRTQAIDEKSGRTPCMPVRNQPHVLVPHRQRRCDSCVSTLHILLGHDTKAWFLRSDSLLKVNYMTCYWISHTRWQQMNCWHYKSNCLDCGVWLHSIIFCIRTFIPLSWVRQSESVGSITKGWKEF